jgi:hypothetical protein
MLAPAFDLDGNPRPLGTAFDVGAYEFGTVLLPGDYNGDGTVNAADYTVWRSYLGRSTALPNDDTPGDGPDDYDRWKTNFGQTGGAGSRAAGAIIAVPEPTTALLLVVGLIFAPALLRRRSTSP